MFSVRFQTLLIIMTTAVVTIFAYDIVREKTEDFIAIARQAVKKPATTSVIATLESGVTIKLPVLATTTKNTVLSVPDRSTIVFGSSIKRVARESAQTE